MFRLSEGEWEKIPARFKTRVDRVPRPTDVAVARVEVVSDIEHVRKLLTAPVTMEER